MERCEIEQIMKDANVLREGHFLLTSGRHSDKYMQCARVFLDTNTSEVLCKQLAELCKDDNIDVVVGPAVGAIIMAYEVSRHLGVPNFFTERVEGKMKLRRTFEAVPGQRFLIVDDVVTTGGSIFETMECIRELGGVVAATGSIVDRSNGTIDFGVPHRSVYCTEVLSYEQDECPLCAAGKPLEKPGSKKITTF